MRLSGAKSNAARQNQAADGKSGLGSTEVTPSGELAQHVITQANEANNLRSHYGLDAEYLQAAEWFARNYSKPFATAAIERALPAGFSDVGLGILPRLFAQLGMQAEICQIRTVIANPIVLPCIAIDKENRLLVVVKIEREQHRAQVYWPAQQRYNELELDELVSFAAKGALLVTPNSESLLSAELVAAEDENEAAGQPEHWFWQPIKRHWGAWLQILLATLGINILGLTLPIFVMNVYDRVIPNLALVTLWTLVGGVTIALVLDLVLKMVRSAVLEQAGRRIDMKVAADLFQHAMNIRLLDRKGGAAAMANQVREFEHIREFFASSSLVAAFDFLFIGIFITVLWIIVGPIAMVPLIAVPLVILLALVARVPMGKSVQQSQQLSAKRHHVLIETMLGMETIKSLNAERIKQREWEEAIAASSRIQSHSKFWSNFAVFSTMGVQQAVSVIIIVWGVYLVSQGSITVGGLIAANLLAGRVLAPLGNITQTLIRAQYAFKSLQSISELMAIPTENSAKTISELTVNNGSLEFRSVEFTYPGAPMPALNDISFKVAAGESVAILGRVGSGKTTLGKLIAGLMQPQQGMILFDGRESGQFDSAMLREGVGYLPQDPEIFTGTIRDNLIMGKPDASDEEINKALYFAGMDRFIAEDPQGLGQFVGEKGNRLSGGQRQSIALARLLLRKPKILFLDEPTNAMDHTTQAIVIQRLAELAKDNVSMVISTHRYSLAQIASKILVMDKGRKLMEGPAKAVLAKITSSNTLAESSQGQAGRDIKPVQNSPSDLAKPAG